MFKVFPNVFFLRYSDFSGYTQNTHFPVLQTFWHFIIEQTVNSTTNGMIAVGGSIPLAAPFTKYQMVLNKNFLYPKKNVNRELIQKMHYPKDAIVD